MAQTFLTAAMGAAANDGSGSKIRVGGLAIVADLTELFTRVADLEASIVTPASLLRAAKDVAATGAPYQVILYSSEFTADAALVIIDNEGLGIEIAAQDANGFTINVGSAGNFSYVALIEV